MSSKTPREIADSRMSALKSERSMYIEDWRDMSDFVIGARGMFLLSKGQKNTDRRNPRLYNEEANFSCSTLASGMSSGITSPARPWFKLATPDRDLMKFGPVKEWLNEVEKILLGVFAKSNFYSGMHSIYKELGCFGTGTMGIYKDPKTIIRCETYTAGSYCLASNARHEVDTFYREYNLTVEQTIEKFGLDKVSQTVKNLYDKGNYDSSVEILHAIEPNRNRNHQSKLAKDMAFSSNYFEKGHNNSQALLLSGFTEDPILSPRWETIGNEVYASVYPAINCINTNKSLQIEELDKHVAIEKMHNPPLVADSSVAADQIDLLAGGITFAPNMAALGKPSIQSIYDVNLNINDLKEDIRIKESRIQRAFYADLFMMITELDRSQITATEIAERKEEKMIMLGPVLESLNTEALDKAIDRVFNIVAEAKMLPPPPQELREMNLEIEYVSILSQAQKAVSTASMETTARFAGELANIVPEAADKINVDGMIDEYAKARGAPPNAVRGEKEVAMVRDQRRKQQAAQQQAEQAQQAIAAAKTIGDTNIGEDSALSQLMGGN